MLAKCINKKHYVCITEGVYYFVYHQKDNQFYIKDDNNDGYYYDTDCFQMVVETEEEYQMDKAIKDLQKEIAEKQSQLKKLINERNNYIKCNN